MTLTEQYLRENYGVDIIAYFAERAWVGLTLAAMAPALSMVLL